jgi:23S rRNA pseudouridine2605 synthase
MPKPPKPNPTSKSRRKRPTNGTTHSPKRKTTRNPKAKTSTNRPGPSTTRRKTQPKRTKKSPRRTTRPEAAPEIAQSERLQKVLARAGLGSRRKIEDRIAAGEVKLDGQTAELGATVAHGSTVELDGKRFRVSGQPTAHRTLIYHKPEGEVTTRSDPEGRKTVFDRLPRLDHGRWIAIGRLDINTAGLLVLTTDGELANRMMHPSGRVDREYLCRIRGTVDEEQVEQLKRGVTLDDGPARFTDIVPGEVTEGHSWFTVALMEGRYREVRRLWEAVGAQVARLKRVRFGPVFLPARVRSGHYEELTPADHRILREDVGLAPAATELELVPDKQR